MKVKNGYKIEKNGWKYISIKGKPYELGYAHGELLSKEIKEGINMLKFSLYDSHGLPFDFFIEVSNFFFKTKIQENYPELMEELKGILNGANKHGAGITLDELILWNNDHDIFSLRISSELFPHFTDAVTDPYTLDFAKEELKKVGELAKKIGQRLTFHPGQFNQVGANKKEVLESTIKDLSMHCDIFDMMELDDNAIVNIHLGGMYGDKEKTKRRWIEQFDDLPTKIKRRLTIENDEKCYSVRDCLDVAAETGIPVVLDNHHYQCYNLLHPDEEPEEIEDLITEVIEDSWKDRKVLFHISEQDTSKKCGAHSKYISKLPDYYLEIPEKYDVDLWIDIEAKEKEKAVLKLYDVHPEIFKF